MKISHKEHFGGMLRSAGFKATPARLALLKALGDSHKPLSISVISKHLAGIADQATIYRALEALTEVGLVKKVDFQDSHTYYELLLGRPHHHHVVCQECGTVEDVEDCNVRGLETSVLKQCKKFSSIKSHSLEFFGVCSKCV